MSDATLPLSLDSSRNLEAFFVGLEDERVRAHLKESEDAAPGVREVAMMVDDEQFLGMAAEARQMLEAALPQRAGDAQLTPGAQIAVAPDAAEALRARGEEINAYLEQHYPNGLALMRGYGNMTQPSLEAPVGPGGGSSGPFIITSTAANVKTAANAFVATTVVVTVSGVVFVAAFVIGG